MIESSKTESSSDWQLKLKSSALYVYYFLSKSLVLSVHCIIWIKHTYDIFYVLVQLQHQANMDA